MKEFCQLAFDPNVCEEQLEAFANSLEQNSDLEETATIKPFFEANLQLALFIGSTFAPMALGCDLYSFQYQLFGDFSCDMVVGDSRRHVYGFVEWEDGCCNSLFRTQGRKSTPEWSSRLERRFIQIVDWFWKLDDMSRTNEFEIRFGSRRAQWFGLLVIGRDSELVHSRERDRWDWRCRNVQVNGHRIRLSTYDDLLRDMRMLFEYHYYENDSSI